MKTPLFRIATYNLQKCVGLDLRRRPDRSLQVINALQAQIVVMQEADKRLPPRPAALPHEMVEQHGWSVLPFGEPAGSLGWHGNAMIVDDKVVVHGTGHIELPGLEPRGAIYADLSIRDTSLRVVGLHLGLVRRYRFLQLATVIRRLNLLPKLPTVLAGDFNEWRPHSALFTRAHDLKFLDTGPTFPAPRPVARLDKIAHTPDLKSVLTGIYTSRPAKIASDHLAVWADMRAA